jgi:DNA-binding XRE family transcriptional regulator
MLWLIGFYQCVFVCVKPSADIFLSVMDARQCRMARCGLGWQAKELAERAGVSYPSVHRFESGQVVAEDTRDKLAAALVNAGAQFVARSGRVGVTIPKN